MINQQFNNNQQVDCLNLCIKQIESFPDLLHPKIQFIKSQNSINNIEDKFNYDEIDLNETLPEIKSKINNYQDYCRQNYYKKLQPPYHRDWQKDFLNKYLSETENKLDSQLQKTKTQIIQLPENQKDVDMQMSWSQEDKVLEQPLMQATKQWIYNQSFDHPLKDVQISKRDNAEDIIKEHLNDSSFILEDEIINNQHFEHDSVKYIRDFPRMTKNYLKNINQDQLKPCILDVYQSDSVISNELKNKITNTIDQIGLVTKDFPIDQQQNIIDPNLFMDEQKNWIATTQKIEKIQIDKQFIYGSINQFLSKNRKDQRISLNLTKIILSYLKTKEYDLSGDLQFKFRAHPLDTIQDYSFSSQIEVNDVMCSILNAALPLLASISKPSLLFPGYLQVVPKAQRIQLQPGEEQDGIWHQDGKDERIVAVILYQQRCQNFSGGAVEFLKRTGKNFYISESKFQNIRDEPHCKVETKEGRLMVFGNYESVHRVLKMVNHTSQVAQRDFVALFIVDQRQPLHSANDIINNDQLRNQMEMTNKVENRIAKFKGQLQPKKQYGLNFELAQSTGNGTPAQVMFQANCKEDEKDFTEGCSEADLEMIKVIERLNLKPPENRGISWDTENMSDPKQKHSDDKFNV